MNSNASYSSEKLERIKVSLSDYKFRFSRLYYIKPKDAGVPECVIVPKPEQWEILKLIYEDGNTRLAILKARQLGMSTLLALICLDMILFNAGFKCGIVDQTLTDAVTKMEKVFFAWDRLPEDLRGAYEVLVENKSELRVRRPGKADSSVYGGKNARGGTHEFLWISEWGAIQFDDPKRSDEIADGGLPSAESGIIVVETTWKGGKTGRLYTDVVEESLKIDKRYRTKEDWDIKFYAWWLDATYSRDGDVSQITPECIEYLEEIEEVEWIEIPPHQKLWYFKVAWPKRQKRYEEYPSTLHEIFKSPVDGAIYADYYTEAEIDGRILDFKAHKSEFYTFWDIGKSDLMTILFIQRVGLQDRVFDGAMFQGETLEHCAKYVQRWEKENDTYIAKNYLPHDAGHERLGKYSNKSVGDLLKECGLRGIEIVPVIPLVNIGIDHVRDRFPSLVFHKTNLERVYEFGKSRISFNDAFLNYRYKPVEAGKSSTEPMHDIYSHPCDALRTYAEADERGMVPKVSGMRQIDEREEQRHAGRANTGFGFWE